MSERNVELEKEVLELRDCLRKHTADESTIKAAYEAITERLTCWADASEQMGGAVNKQVAWEVRTILRDAEALR